MDILILYGPEDTVWEGDEVILVASQQRSNSITINIANSSLKSEKGGIIPETMPQQSQSNPSSNTSTQARTAHSS